MVSMSFSLVDSRWRSSARRASERRWGRRRAGSAGGGRRRKWRWGQRWPSGTGAGGRARGRRRGGGAARGLASRFFTVLPIYMDAGKRKWTTRDSLRYDLTLGKFRFTRKQVVGAPVILQDTADLDHRKLATSWQGGTVDLFADQKTWPRCLHSELAARFPHFV
jgi:hypothetical protein